jgi:hypothetical protein
MTSSNQVHTYYKLIMYDACDTYSTNGYTYGKQKTGKKTYSWLRYDGDDKDLTYCFDGREDESLAIQILLQNKDTSRMLRGVLENVLLGHFETVIVKKFQTSRMVP